MTDPFKKYTLLKKVGKNFFFSQVLNSSFRHKIGVANDSQKKSNSFFLLSFLYQLLIICHSEKLSEKKTQGEKN